MNIWQYSKALSNRLTQWNIINILAGLLLWPGGAFWRGFGSQNIGWGIINLGIAFFGSYFTQQRFDALENPLDAEIQIKEARSLRRLLWINAGLDVLYMLGGQWLAQTRGSTRPYWRGLGWGIVLQGALLFVFDVIHALAVPRKPRS